MIVSFIEGRVRLRHAALKNNKMLHQVMETLHGFEGMAKLTPNPSLGSLLIEYDPSVISQDMLSLAAQTLEVQLDALPPQTPHHARRRRRSSPRRAARPMMSLESRFLFALLAASALSGFMGRRLHLLLGLAFTAASLKHFFRFNKPRGRRAKG